MNRAEKRRQQKLAKKAAKNKTLSPPATLQQDLDLAVGHHRTGRVVEAERLYTQVLKADPNQPVALHLLGAIALQAGNLEVAIDLIGKAINIQPDYVDAHNNLGLALHKNGQLEDAIRCFQKALKIKPEFAEAHCNMGVVLGQMNDIEQAKLSFQKAAALKPDYTQAHFNFGNALKNQGAFEDAILSYKKVIAINPAHIDAYMNMGIALQGLKRTDEALSSYRRAIDIKPDFAEAHFNMANAFHSIAHMDEAKTCFEKTLAIKPDYTDAYNNFGNALRDMGQPEAAMDSYRQALAIDPDFAEAHSNLIFTQDHIAGINQAEQQAERARWDAHFIQPLACHIKPHSNTREAERRLRIGYVSADFRRHSACTGFAPLIINHDARNFDVFCYDCSPASDATTQALRGAATHWRSVKDIDDTTLAATIMDDAIDILIDLSGHTCGNRLKVFGRKPAPLQLSGIGHLAPGLSTIDYRLTTAKISPPGEEHIYPEQAVYLQTYFGFTPPPDLPPVGPAPCLENGFMTFGFLGRFCKTTDQLMALWASILRDVPNSRLLLKFAQLDDPAAGRKIHQFFANKGIGEDRLSLLGLSDQHQHLKTHNKVDMVFDSIPHGGGITTLESLLMGVPVIGLIDPNKAGGRMIDSINAPLGLEDWATRSLEQYHTHAVEWAARHNQLAQIRARLRGRVSGLYGCFVRDVENSYRLMWKRWCAGEAPSPLHPL